MKIVIGMTGSGKSMSQVPSIVEAALSDDHEKRTALYISDPHGTMGWEVARQIVAAGHGHRLIYDELADVDWPLCWEWFARSESPLGDRREIEEADYINGFLDYASFARGEEQLHTRPWILKWSTDALKLLSRQVEKRPLSDVLWVLRPGHLHFHELVQGCLDEELKWEFHDMSRSRDKKKEVRSAELFLAQVIKTPFVWNREGAFKVGDHLRQGCIVIVDGRGINPEVRRVAIGCRNLAVLHAVNLGIGRDLLYVQDEAQDFLTKFTAMATAHAIE